MIPIRKIVYDSDEDAKQLFSRLTWVVERVDRLWTQLIFNATVNTTRSWVGSYDKDKMTFAIIEPRSFFSMNFIHVI